MVFYLVPPTGTMNLHNLEGICEARFQFLSQVAQAKSIEDFQRTVESECFVKNSACLMEYNPKDSVSHFALRLLSADIPALASVVRAGEQQLFRFRLRLMTPADLTCLLDQLWSTARWVRRNCRVSRYLDTVVSTAAAALHHLRSDHRQREPEFCRQPVLRVPFQQVLPLVAGRSVRLDGGYALVTCDQVSDVLACLHDTALSATSAGGAVDPRLLPLRRRLELQLSRPSTDGASCLTLERLDEAVSRLPPCMLQLWDLLLERHRLSHGDRIVLTLFLKDAGMPLEENIRFWGREYSQPAACGSACSHDWDRHRRRYMYGVRHLYGREGARVSYSSHTCRSLQDTCGASVSSCGGCPFVGSDDDRLASLLTRHNRRMTPADVSSVLSLRAREPDRCCRLYLHRLLGCPATDGCHDNRPPAGGCHDNRSPAARSSVSCPAGASRDENASPAGCHGNHVSRSRCHDNGCTTTNNVTKMGPAIRAECADNRTLAEVIETDWEHFKRPSDFFRAAINSQSGNSCED